MFIIWAYAFSSERRSSIYPAIILADFTISAVFIILCKWEVTHLSYVQTLAVLAIRDLSIFLLLFIYTRHIGMLLLCGFHQLYCAVIVLAYCFNYLMPELGYPFALKAYSMILFYSDFALGRVYMVMQVLLLMDWFGYGVISKSFNYFIRLFSSSGHRNNSDRDVPCIERTKEVHTR